MNLVKNGSSKSMMPISMSGMKTLVKNLHVMLNVKVFAKQDGRLASHTNMTHYIDPYDTHMDPKQATILIWIQNKQHPPQNNPLTTHVHITFSLKTSCLGQTFPQHKH